MVMKKMKRFLSFAMSAMMILTMGTSIASADETETTYSITIHAKEQGHTFGAFQIFSGNVAQLTSTENAGGSSTTTTYLTDVKWTESVNEDVVKAFIEELKEESSNSSSVLSGAFSSLTAEKTDASATKVMDLAEELDTDAKKEKFAEIIGQYFANKNVTPTKTASDSSENADLVEDTTYYDYRISNLPAGYYIVKDTGATGDGGVGTKYILNVTSNSEVYSKAGQTTLTKEVSKNSNNGFGHSTDSTVGNEVYFKLTATLPELVDDFASYRLTFEDILPEGLTYTGIVSAKMEHTSSSVDLTGDSYTVENAKTDGEEITQLVGNGRTAFYIKTKNLKAYRDLDNLWEAGATITFVYSAKLNEEAQVGGSGNVNKAKLYYTNDPYVYPNSDDRTESDDPEGETPEADAIVFTYAFQGDKVDGEDTTSHLSGAEFILYKDGTTTVDDNTVNIVSYVSEVDATKGNIKTWSSMAYGDGQTYKTKDAAIEAIINIESGTDGYAYRFVSGTDGLFKISGLGADVKFYLKETKAPTAYSIMTSPFTFTISATRTTAGTETATLQATDHNSQPLQSNERKDTILATITNTKGGQLPSTGGMGRTIIYAIGIVLTLSAAILLVVKKRMHADF